MPHNELLFKLWQMGITGPLWLWFREYLSCHLHFVSIDGCTSDLLPVLSGVPQGSILGPLLFIMYVNDIPERILHSSVFMFADDTKLIKAIANANRMLFQEDLSALKLWCVKWLLCLHATKCVAMEFSLSALLQPDCILDEVSLPVKDSHQDLGVTVCHVLS